MLNLNNKKIWPGEKPARKIPDIVAVAPLKFAWENLGLEAAEQTRFNGTATSRIARLNSAEGNGNKQFKRIFIKQCQDCYGERSWSTLLYR